MRTLVVFLRVFGWIAGCLGLVLAFQRCSPIAPSAKKTLINSEFSSSYEHDRNNSNSIHADQPDPNLQSAPAKTFLVQGKLIDKATGAEILTQLAEEPKPKNFTDSVVLSRIQLKDLRENKRTVIQLSFEPSSEMTLFFQVASFATAPAEIADKDAAPFVEVRFKAIGASTWMMSLIGVTNIEQSHDSDVRMNWLTNSLQSVMIFTGETPSRVNPLSSPSPQD